MRWTEEEYARHMNRDVDAPEKTPRASPQQIEHEHAVALMDWKAKMLPRYPALRLLHAIPNGGDRHPFVAARIAAEGTVPGVSDYHLPVARGGFIGLYVELKAPGGKASQAQLDWLDAVRAEGHAGFVCEGWTEAVIRIVEYLDRPPTKILVDTGAA